LLKAFTELIFIVVKVFR